MSYLIKNGFMEMELHKFVRASCRHIIAHLTTEKS